jgi:hypothetical protein
VKEMKNKHRNITKLLFFLPFVVLLQGCEEMITIASELAKSSAEIETAKNNRNSQNNNYSNSSSTNQAQTYSANQIQYYIPYVCVRPRSNGLYNLCEQKVNAYWCNTPGCNSATSEWAVRPGYNSVGKEAREVWVCLLNDHFDNTKKLCWTR